VAKGPQRARTFHAEKTVECTARRGMTNQHGSTSLTAFWNVSGRLVSENKEVPVGEGVISGGVAGRILAASHWLHGSACNSQKNFLSWQ